MRRLWQSCGAALLRLCEVLLSDRLLCSPAKLNALPALTPLLLQWYRAHARPLPWREDSSPYHIWISEIMLQQTRVETVKGYYSRFVDALPAIPDLAAVPEDKLLKLWEGLGYYSRARNMQRAAKILMDRHNGALPASYGALLELPGIGKYTAGAIASIAFGIPVPAVDGNVYRVLSRILAGHGDTSQTTVRSAFHEAAASMLSHECPGDLNQALMELGATVCLPNGAPLCDDCPVKAHCGAKEEGCIRELPVKGSPKPRRVEARTVVVVASPEGILLFRRKDKGLLAGMYEPLNLAGHLDEPAAQHAIEALGGMPLAIESLGCGKHVFSHVEWHMKAFLIRAASFETEEGIWVERSALHFHYPMPNAFRTFFQNPDRLFQFG